VGGFNDLFTDAAGRVYVGSLRSDPFELGGEREAGELYRIDSERSSIVLYGGVGLSNGIGFSPDGKTLYHSDTAAGRILAHDVDAAGRVANRRAFAVVGGGAPDGLAVDAEGGIWVASYGGAAVHRYTPEGALERRIEIPAQRVTSLCFGGSDRRDLYIVSADNRDAPERGGTIFRGRSEIPGLPVPAASV
jgi:sugar lactone lactonase YvrE